MCLLAFKTKIHFVCAVLTYLCGKHAELIVRDLWALLLLHFAFPSIQIFNAVMFAKGIERLRWEVKQRCKVS